MAILEDSESIRQRLVHEMYGLQGKLTYTQGPRRDDIEDGYGDCSSVVRWVYQKVMHIDIGDDTAEQIVSFAGYDIDNGECPNNYDTHNSVYPDEKKLLPGDLLFFTGGDESRPYAVGHVEMYVGHGKLIGQNGRKEKGTFEKKLDEYMAYIDSIHLKYIKTRRFIH